MSYRTEQNALDALENLKGNDTLVELDVADDCKMENYEDQLQLNMEEEIPEIFICMGTFQLSFTTTKYLLISCYGFSLFTLQVHKYWGHQLSILHLWPGG